MSNGGRGAGETVRSEGDAGSTVMHGEGATLHEAMPTADNDFMIWCYHKIGRTCACVFVSMNFQSDSRICDIQVSQNYQEPSDLITYSLVSRVRDVCDKAVIATARNTFARNT